MDILNFISWIRSGRVVNTVDPAQALLPVGLKDNRRDDGYLAGAISVTDLLELVPPLFGPNYIFIEGRGTPVENGKELYDTYLAAITKTPNGLPLSDDNRYTILLAPGVYQVPNTLIWNTDFIDLACIDGVATLKSPFLYGVPIVIAANDTQFSNIKLAFLFLESQFFIGWPIRPNKSKVLLNNCSGYYENNQYSEEYTIDRDYLNTSVSRRISQNCLGIVAFYLGYNYVNLDPNAGSIKTQFWYSETTNLLQQSRFDLGAMGTLFWGANLSTGPYTTLAYVQETSLPPSDKYIQMNISNLVGTFSINDVVTQGGTTGIIMDTDGATYFIAYVATGVFPNGTGTVTNTTSGGTADNNGWGQWACCSVTSGGATGFTNNFYQGNFLTASLNTFGTSTNYIAQGFSQTQFDPQMYILYEGPNISLEPGTASVIYNNLGGTAVPAWGTSAGELIIQGLSGAWDGATQIWSDLNPTPVTITNRSQNVIHTLNKTVTNR